MIYRPLEQLSADPNIISLKTWKLDQLKRLWEHGEVTHGGRVVSMFQVCLAVLNGFVRMSNDRWADRSINTLKCKVSSVGL
ncbi:hypothetical protein AHF37_02977 [Paragonimus kellicotti]|nr:hypothetical protein AHF37_02977 [Paragonimus kellicotti]